MKSLFFTLSAVVVAVTFGCGITGYSVYVVLALSLYGAYLAIVDVSKL